MGRKFTFASSQLGFKPIGTPPCCAAGAGVGDGKYFPVQVSGVELALETSTAIRGNIKRIMGGSILKTKLSNFLRVFVEQFTEGHGVRSKIASSSHSYRND